MGRFIFLRLNLINGFNYLMHSIYETYNLAITLISENSCRSTIDIYIFIRIFQNIHPSCHLFVVKIPIHINAIDMHETPRFNEIDSTEPHVNNGYTKNSMILQHEITIILNTKYDEEWISALLLDWIGRSGIHNSAHL